MLIEESSVPVTIEPKRQNYFWPLVLGTIITLTATTLPILFVVVKNDRPTGTLLSPIPERVITDSRSTPTPSSSQQALILAQNYLSKAYDLLRNPTPSKEDQDAIRVSLEKGLRTAPETTEGLGLRTEILSEIKKLFPDTQVSPVAGQNVIVATAGEDSSSSGTTNSPSNADQNSFIIPAGKTEVTIKNTQVKTDSYIYLLPAENSGVVVSLQSKSAGSFTISADSSSTADLPISYYVINE